MEEQKFQERRKVKKRKRQTGKRLACARGMTYADGDTCVSKRISDRAGAHRRARRPFTKAEIAAWRERIFADGVEDPVKVAVEEAVKDFGEAEDFTIWAWYANRIGVNSFLELYFEQKSIMQTCTLRNPAAAFHARLKRFYAALKEGGAK